MAEIGDSWTRVRTFTQDEFDRFAALTGDDNPIHVDADYAATTVWGRTVAHGMFLYSCLCGMLSEAFPGAVQERQDLKFPAPTYPGDEMTLTARVVAVAGPRTKLVVDVIDPGGTVTCTGEAVLRSAAT